MTSDTNGAQGGSVEEIEAEIARTREELATTVDQLAARLDVKARARDRVHELRGAVTDGSGHPTPATLKIAGAVLAGGVVLVAVIVWRRRR